MQSQEDYKNFVSNDLNFKKDAQKLLEASRIESVNNRLFTTENIVTLIDTIQNDSDSPRDILLKILINIYMLNPSVRQSLNYSQYHSIIKWIELFDSDLIFIHLRLNFVLTAYRQDLCTADALDNLTNALKSFKLEISRNEQNLIEVLKLAYNFQARLGFVQELDFYFDIASNYVFAKTDQVETVIDWNQQFLSKKQWINITNDVAFQKSISLLTDFEQKFDNPRNQKQLLFYECEKLVKVCHVLINYLANFDSNSQNEEALTYFIYFLINATSLKDARIQLKSQILPDAMDRTKPLNLGNNIWNVLINHLVDIKLSMENKNLLALLFYHLCNRSVQRLVSYVGYGPVSSFLMMNGLLQSQDNLIDQQALTDSGILISQIIQDQNIDIVTGAIKKETIQEMTEEEQEKEAQRLMGLIDKLNKTGVIQMQYKTE